MDFYSEILSNKTKEVLIKLKQLPMLGQFFLAGGTGLALQLGHRISYDLDFFTEEKFDTSILGYQYPVLFPFLKYEDIQIADWRDIACMKIDTIASRGAKRDFVDVHFIAGKMPLSQLLELFSQKYQAINYNIIHIKKSLVYFEDAEQDPMPKMLKSADWQNIKNYFQKEIKELK